MIADRQTDNDLDPVESSPERGVDVATGAENPGPSTSVGPARSHRLWSSVKSFVLSEKGKRGGLFLLRWVGGPFLLLLLCVFFVDWVVMPWITHRGEEFPAPDLMGRTIEEAQSRLAEENCELEIEGRRYSANYPPDVVLLQRPTAGYPIKTGRRFRVVVSLGAESVIIPTVRGYSARQARMILVEAGLSPGKVGTIDDPKLPRGVVASTVPGAGSDVLSGTTVNIMVNDTTGTGIAWMPNLVGNSLEEATRILTGHRLVVRDIKYVFDSTLLPGTVIGQSEIPGFELEEGTEVDLTVSNDQ